MMTLAMHGSQRSMSRWRVEGAPKVGSIVGHAVNQESQIPEAPDPLRMPGEGVR
jgi:hypothetical protein